MDSLQASRIAGGNTAYKRAASDFYPTPPDVTFALMKFLSLEKGAKIWDKTTPRLIQFHTLKNAVNPPFLGGFLISGTVAA